MRGNIQIEIRRKKIDFTGTVTLILKVAMISIEMHVILNRTIYITMYIKL